MNTMNTEGDILRIELKKRKISQEDFASSMGFSRTYLQRLLTMARIPDEMKAKISTKLELANDNFWKTGESDTPLESAQDKYIASLEETVRLQKEMIQILKEKLGIK